MNIIPFDSPKLPAYLTIGEGYTTGELGSVGGSFPVVSIKGKTFAVKRGDEKTIVMKDDAPAPYIDVVIVKVWPLKSADAKVYYANGYVEGSEDKPTCSSNDGVTPNQDSAEIQSAQCATCPRNQWGSRITESGAKAKECQDSKRLAIAVPGALGDPMLLRVPATSLKPLAQYGAFVEKRGVPYYGVLTRIGFDYTVAHPSLTFKAIGLLDQDSVKEVLEMRDSDVVAEICGTQSTLPTVSTQAALPTVNTQAAPAPATKTTKGTTKTTKAEGKAQAALDAMLADVEAAPKADIKVEAAPQAAPVTVEDDDDLANAIARLDLDD